MKGHPGYQGDDLDWLASVIRRVNSPRTSAVRHFTCESCTATSSDASSNAARHHQYVHTARGAGRGELDDRQEIQYPAVMPALLDIKYAGYVGQESIPTRNAEEGLRQAVRLCDV